MSELPPARVLRSIGRALMPLVVIALRKDVPIPRRLMALQLLKVNIDQLACRESKILGIIGRYARAITDFMRNEGYEIPEPGSSTHVLEWIRKVCKRNDGESISEWLDRTALFLARVVAVITTVTLAEAESLMHEEVAAVSSLW